MKRFLIVFFTTFILSACGGGGGGGESSNTPSTPDQPPRKFSDLVVPEGFTFKTSYTVSIDLNLDGQDPRFLNIYGRFSESSDGTPIPDTSSLLVSSNVTTGNFRGRFTVTGHLKTLLIEAWPQDGKSEPFRKVVHLPMTNILVSQ
ncbi:hypothetical protein [Photobacterium sanguinicancri]|uniref:hypothetical protein n=1 Tax=Photobacterium sanguinicancri TaxID=875932 RepID=UPI003D118B50